MAKEMGLGAALVGAAVVAASAGSPAAPVTPHVTPFVAAAGVSATMSSEVPVDSFDPFLVFAVLLCSLFAFLVGRFVAAWFRHLIPARVGR